MSNGFLEDDDEDTCWECEEYWEDCTCDEDEDTSVDWLEEDA